MIICASLFVIKTTCLKVFTETKLTFKLTEEKTLNKKDCIITGHSNQNPNVYLGMYFLKTLSVCYIAINK